MQSNAQRQPGSPAQAQANRAIPGGVWPTMVTPYTEDNRIDYAALERLIDWYIGRGVDGLFAVCQSSEMFYLSREERVELAAFVKQKAAGRVPVIASGHVSDLAADQLDELRELASTGIDALVLITNRLAGEGESEQQWLTRLEQLLGGVPDNVPLGFYECPYPYKRLISPEALRWCADTGRFRFLKDTSCDTANMQAKLEATAGSGLQLYNANSATLLETLELGAAGYSGVMANFHPELYVWLYRNWQEQPERAKQLSDFLSLASMIEKQLYPVNAKYHLMLEGVLDNCFCRSKNAADLTNTYRLEVQQLRRLTQAVAAQLDIAF